MEESVGKPNVFLVQVSEPGSVNILKNNKYKNDRWQSKSRDRAHGEVSVGDLLLIYFAGGAIDYQKQLKFVYKVTDVSKDNIEFRLERFEELNPFTLDQIRENVKKEILPDMFLNCGRQGFNICKIRHSDYEKIRQISEKLPSVSPMIGAENLLEDFVVNNWRPSEFFDRGFAQLEILKDKDGEIIGQQYDTREVGIIDLLCIDKDTGDYVVIEIKRGNETSDEVVGQLTRYMGWVKARLAEDKNVHGIILSAGHDEKIKYSISVVPNCHLAIYDVQFKIKLD